MRLRSLLLALSLPACATSQGKLIDDAYDRLPKDARSSLYDGENDIVIARSRRDEASAQLLALDREETRVDEVWKHTEARLKKANLGDHIASAKKVISARRDYLSAQRKIVKSAIRTADAEIDLSRARLALVRQRQLARIGLVLPSTVEGMEKDVTAEEKGVREVQRKELDVRVDAQKLYVGWKSAEDEYARASSDYDSEIWID